MYYIVKDAEDTSKTLGTYHGTPSQDAMLTTGKYKLITKTSQIDQADQLVRSVKKSMPERQRLFQQPAIHSAALRPNTAQ